MAKPKDTVGGWAIYDAKRGVLVNTVSDTRRAALVNWLVTERSELVRASTTDDQIENMWAGLKGSADLCTTVNVSRAVTFKDD